VRREREEEEEEEEEAPGAKPQAHPISSLLGLLVHLGLLRARSSMS
jgi:hypothetical protein